MKPVAEFLDDLSRDLEGMRLDVHHLREEPYRDMKLTLPEIEKKLGTLVDSIDDYAARVRITEQTKNETPKGR